MILFALLPISTVRSVPEISRPVLYDTRLVHDVAALSRAGKPKYGLFLAEIDADLTSGDLIAEGPYINGKTGQLVEPPGSKWEVIMSGAIRVLSTEAPPSPPFKSEPYRWPVRETQPDPEDAAYYTPFRSGGLALCGYNDNEGDSRQFDPVYLVPKEWQRFVKPAYKSVAAQPALFDPKAASSHRIKLTKLLGSPNPLLAQFAAETLCASGKDNWAYVRAHWGDSTGLRGAANLLTVLETAPPDASQRLTDALAAEASTSSPAVTRQILLAAVAGLFDPPASPAYVEGNALLDGYQKAIAKRGLRHGTDPEIAQLLELTGR